DELDLIQLAAHIAGLAIEHAQAEIALREGEERFREFMRYLPGSVQIKDDAGYVLYCNERYAALNDRTPEEIIGTRPTDHLPEALARMFDHEHERVLRENRALEFHHDLQHTADSVRFWTIRFPIPRAGKPPLVGTISLDVTREKLAEDALKRSEERYRQMFERVRLPKFIVDAQTAAILDANPGAVEFYGYPLETLKTMTMLDINIAEPEIIREKLRQVMAGEISSCEFTQRLADGSTRDTESYAVAIEHNGQPAVYCTYIDVTERNRAQAALKNANQVLEQRVLERTAELQEERNLLRTVIDTVPDFIYVKDAQHRMVLNNAAHARSLGERTEAEIVGKTDFDFFPPDMAAKFHADEDRLFATEQALVNAEERSIGEKRGEIWALTTKVPLRNLQGKLIGLVGITHDVTVMKAAAEALQISEERYRATIAAMSEGLVVQNRDGAIVVCNNAAEWMLGLTADQMLGRTSVDPRWRAVHEDGSPFPGETHPAMETLRTGQPQHGVVMGVHKPDGTLTWLLVNAKPLLDPADGQLYAVVTTFADISAPKQAEAVIKAALAQEKELSELKSRLVSMASHEFRTPLASILTATETLIRYWERLDKEKINERLERVREQVEHMTAITEDVLQLSRLQMGRAKYEPAVGDLDALCAHVVSKLAELPDVGRRIVYACAEHPLNAVFDARLIEQVINNLLHNALKYSPAEKPVQISL
ncbi:MAG: PAS domain S-box protein, partial [Anaerolinea sp.]|nr:PAS domain S-box protein [Anaerolinea sp.]